MGGGGGFKMLSTIDHRKHQGFPGVPQGVPTRYKKTRTRQRSTTSFHDFAFISTMARCAPLLIFRYYPTTSFHDFAYMLHWLYVLPFSFFDIPHHISSRPCTHFTMDSRCSHAIFLMFLVASLLVLFMWVFLLFLQSAFFPSHRKARCL